VEEGIVAGKTPLETIERLVMAINQRDLENAVSLYEPTGVLVVEPGKIARGTSELKEALQGFLSLRPTLTTIKHELIQVGDFALYFSDWKLLGTGPDNTPVEMEGRSSDLLRRKSDGTWLIAIDNPWGSAVLG
jgi:ketosteroid isomerase-like protein